MADNFSNYNQGLDSPANNIVSVTPTDSDLATDFRSIYVGVAGNVAIVSTGGDDVTFVGVLAGSILPVRCRQVKSTGTTATNIIGLY